jgi:hypothetical protein
MSDIKIPISKDISNKINEYPELTDEQKKVYINSKLTQMLQVLGVKVGRDGKYYDKNNKVVDGNNQISQLITQ